LYQVINILLNTILPVFSIILLGFALKRISIIDVDFVRKVNLIVFNIGIPAVIVREITRAPFSRDFNLTAVVCSLCSLCIVLLASMAAAHAFSFRSDRRGTFIQCSIHGNIGYMAYAVAYYALGGVGFARVAILSSFLIVGQNLLSVWALTSYDPRLGANGRKFWLILRNVVRNPIVWSAGFATCYSALGLKVPAPLAKILDILSGLGLPAALLLIGSSLSIGVLNTMVFELFGIGVLKLVALPLVGYFLMVLTAVPGQLVLPGVILLASPPATISYVMAFELGGDPELAATAVSIFTLVSALSYTFVLSYLS
jgi:malate permease and related proteins